MGLVGFVPSYVYPADGSDTVRSRPAMADRCSAA